MSEYLNNNNLPYSESYQASRYYASKVIEKYPNLKLIIDLHRDSLSKENSTTEIDGKKFAKVLFVVGKNNSNYEFLNTTESIPVLAEEKLSKMSQKKKSNISVQQAKDLNQLYQEYTENVSKKRIYNYIIYL